MQILTFWLIVTGFVLLLIISILEWSRPRKAKAVLNSASASAIALASEATALEQQPVLQARITALEQKSLLAHQRIQRIENILSKIPLDNLGQQLDTVELQQKMGRLIEFKNEIHIQMAALEQRLEQQQSKSPSGAEKQLDALERELEQQNKSLKQLEEKIPVIASNQKRKK